MATSKRAQKKTTNVSTDEKEKEFFVKGGKTLVETPLAEELSKSYLDYAYSVIHSRALPDARDGLKPVHRRILYTMFEDGLNPSHSHVKSARVVGNTLGRYHPHGDSSVYEAMVRLAQDFSLNTPLIDGHGNFGSPNDSPAAARYCVTGDTLVHTPDGASVKIKTLAPSDMNSEKATNFEVLDKDGKKVNVVKVFNSGQWPTMKVQTVEGYTLSGSHNHLVLALLAPFGVPILQWVRLDEVKEGMFLAVPTKMHHYDTTPLTEAESEECFSQGKRITSGEFFNNNSVENFFDKIFNYTYFKKKAFLQGVVSAAAQHVSSGSSTSHSQNGLTLTFGDETVAQHIQQLLLTFGVVSIAQFALEKEQGQADPTNEHYVLTIPEQYVHFALKQNLITPGTFENADLPTRYVLKTDNLFSEEAPYVKDYILSESEHGNRMWIKNSPVGNVNFWKMNRALILSKVFNEETVKTVDNIMSSEYHFSKVAAVKSGETATVFSLKVDSEDHSFLAGPFVNHNTEARMSKNAIMLVEEIKEKTVNFVPNYDGSLDEPEVLPAGFPNLLINGTSGIAVGMATNMIPHNPGEVMTAARALLKKPEMTTSQLMKYIPGPDLPTGGLLVGMDEVKLAYETGRGTVRIRCKATVEPLPGSRGRNSIVITELPYQVGTEKIIESIKTEIGKKRIQGISDVKDLSDRKNGIRLVIECKTGVNPTALLNELYRYTPLETSFGINNLTLVEGKPQTLTLKQLLEVFLKHRVDVVTRRTQYRLDKAEARKHIVEGLLIALANVEEVVRVIRKSDDTVKAKANLMKKYKLSDIQTQHILEMPLRRLVNLEVQTLKNEHKELEETIKGLKLILSDESVLKKTIDEELSVVQKNITQGRKTELLGGDLKEIIEASKTSEPIQVPNESSTVYLSASGMLIRSPGENEDVSHAKNPRRGNRAHETLTSSVATSTHNNIIAITNTGKAFRVKVLDIPPFGKETKHISASGGVPVKELLPITSNEEVKVLIPESRDSGKGVALGTKRGVVKICQPDWPSRSDEFEIIKLQNGDEIIGGSWCDDGDIFVFITSHSNLLTYSSNAVRPQGRTGGGVAGIKQPDDAHVLTFNVIPENDMNNYEVFTYTGSTGKRTPLSEYPTKGRGTGGVRSHKFLKGEDRLKLAYVGKNVIAHTEDGKAVDLKNIHGKRDGSGKPLPENVSKFGNEG